MIKKISKKKCNADKKDGKDKNRNVMKRIILIRFTRVLWHINDHKLFNIHRR